MTLCFSATVHFQHLAALIIMLCVESCVV